ncbi:MAG: hypothetical protein ACOX4R_03315 [Lentihominibacter sp.]|jgi:hypothetical protein
MAKIRDYNCLYSTYSGIDKEFVKALGLKMPDFYSRAAGLAKYSAAVKEKNDDAFCKLPFDTFLAGEALGVPMVYDESPVGLRKREDLITNPEEILKLDKIDPSKGRLAETINACDILREQGEFVVFEIRGLFDTLNSLLDIQNVMLFWLTQQEKMQEVCDFLKENLMIELNAAKDHCDMFFYSDASGGVNIIGPKMGKMLVEWFTYPFLKDVAKTLNPGQKMQMCPKTAFMLLGTETGEYAKADAEGTTYFEKYNRLPDNIQFLGEKCNRDLSDTCKGQVNYINLL